MNSVCINEGILYVIIRHSMVLELDLMVQLEHVISLYYLLIRNLICIFSLHGGKPLRNRV